MNDWNQLIEQLSEPTSINLAQNIKYEKIATPLSAQRISTAYVRQLILRRTPPQSLPCQGEGNSPILLLHGFDSSLLEFRRLLPLLATQKQTWAVDLLGFGFSDRIAEIALSPSAIKTHLYHFWQSLIAQPVILVGASMGGAAAIDFTLTYPEVVQKLVLIDSAGFAAGSAMGKLMFPPLDRLATEFLRNPRVRRSISRAAYKNKSLASVDAQLCAAMHLNMPGWNQALIAFTKSGGYTSFKDKLMHIQQPTLILWGENDRILGIADANKFQQAIPHSKLIWIKDCGHVPHLEQPEITAKHISEFSTAMVTKDE